MHLVKHVLLKSFLSCEANPWRGLPAALEERVKERVREHELRANAAKEDAAAAAVGGLCTEARPQSRNKAAHDGSNRTKTRQAAPDPAKQPEKQPASRMPGEAPTPPGDEAACPQHSPAQAELPPQTAAEQSKGQAPDDEKLDASMAQPESTETQAALQRAQARKQKTARRKAAKNKGANLQTKSSVSSSSSCKADSSSQETLQEPALAAARVPALAASAQAFTQPPKTHKTLLRISSQGHTASQAAPENPHSLQQSTSRSLQSAGSSSSSAAPDAMLCGPCLPDAPSGQPAIARPAPVRLPGSCMVRAKA